MLSGILHIMYFDTHVGLADPEAVGYGTGGHPYIYAETGDVSIPDVLFYVILGHIS